MTSVPRSAASARRLPGPALLATGFLRSVTVALLLCGAAAPLLTAAPPKHGAAPRHGLSHPAAKRKGRSGPTPARRSASTRASAQRGGLSAARQRTAKAPGRRIYVDPVSRLEAVSRIASTLSRGASALSYPAALESFYADLAQHEDEPDEGTVRVLQFGDSHTAADMFTGEARRMMQRQFGNGSIGYSYAGHPFAGYRIFGSQRTQSGGWATEGTHFTDLGDGLLGMGGVGVSTARAGEFVTLDAPCTSLELDYLQQPGGGTLHLTDNGAAVSDVSSDGAAVAPGSFSYTCPDSAPGDHHFVVTTATDAPVRLLGLVALQPGVTWESIGINGAEAPLILRWDQSLFTNYLRSASPALVVLAYGTNEAAAHYDPESYSASFERLLETLHRTVPDASVLVLGPTDRALASRRSWRAFSGTDAILDAQRSVCRTHGCAFWDQRRRMGGLGAMQQWVRAGWAQHDHTHLTGEGYRALADALLADVLSGYDAYRKQHGLPSSATIANTVQQGQASADPSPQTH